MAANFIFAQFDPRPAGTAQNDAILASPTLGIEVTVPALAARCQLGNLDHHGPESTSETPAACEQALTSPLPLVGTTLATVRCDGDSVTTMAILASRSEGRPVDEVLVRQIGAADRLGPAAGPRDDRVVAIARRAADFKVPLADRVAWTQVVLAGDSDPVEIARLVAERDRELEQARGASEVKLVADGRIVTVVSTHRFATNLGYEMSPVVVAMNPTFPVDFKDPSKGTCVKFTVCRFDDHVKVDLQAALADLASLEPGWGGRGDIFGSPQGVSSTLPLGTVVEIVARHLR